MSKASDHIHATRDGREIPVGEMETGHLFAAVTSLTKWTNSVEDPDRKAEAEIRLMWIELRSRKKPKR